MACSLGVRADLDRCRRNLFLAGKIRKPGMPQYRSIEEMTFINPAGDPGALMKWWRSGCHDIAARRDKEDGHGNRTDFFAGHPDRRFGDRELHPRPDQAG
jgi:hypothetical protein